MEYATLCRLMFAPSPSGIALFSMSLWEIRRRGSQYRTTVDDVIRAQTFDARMAGQTGNHAHHPLVPT
jgi:hypothetical protein